MSRRAIYLVGGLCLVSALALGMTSSYAPFHPKCDLLAAGSDLERRLEIDIPKSRRLDFNDQLVRYLANGEYTFQTSQDANYLSPPDAEGRQARFRNIKTIGCTFSTVVWSENVLNENQFTLTVHSTAFGSKAKADETASDLKELASTFGDVQEFR